jgi:hypothetical protein
MFCSPSASPVEPNSHIVPVPQIPDRVEELDLSVLVLEVEGVFPCVEHEIQRTGPVRAHSPLRVCSPPKFAPHYRKAAGALRSPAPLFR